MLRRIILSLPILLVINLLASDAFSIVIRLQAGGFRYTFLVYSAREKIWRGVYLEFEEKPPRKVKIMNTGDTKPRKLLAGR